MFENLFPGINFYYELLDNEYLYLSCYKQNILFKLDLTKQEICFTLSKVAKHVQNVTMFIKNVFSHVVEFFHKMSNTFLWYHFQFECISV